MLTGQVFNRIDLKCLIIDIPWLSSEIKDIDFRAKAMTILCLSDEVLYNIMNEKTTAGLWYRLESLYI